MKSSWTASCCTLALLVGWAAEGLAAQGVDASQSESRTPKPTLEEELVHLRGVLAVQTLRLDEAEQLLRRQGALIDTQQAEIDALRGSEGRRASAAAQGQQAMTGEHIVQRGENLFRISLKYKISVDRLAQANKIAPPYELRVGQRLVVPAGPRAPGPALAQQQDTPPPSPRPTTGVQSQAQAQQAQAQQAQAQQAQIQAQREAAQSPGQGGQPRQASPEARTQQVSASAQSSEPEQVGARPEDEDRAPYLAVFSDVGGILTPRGTLFAEPEVDYTVSADNRFFFQGVEIIDAILIGLIEATNTDRTAFTTRMGLRYGLANRLEIDGRVSYVDRNDRISGIAIDSSTETIRNLSGSGFGDAEVGVHYQLNSGRGLPFTILNLRAKAPTGKGPFDINRDTRGLETELATGSGFWTLEPSVTLIMPSDPAVLFANVGYQVNLSNSPDAPIGQAIVREFDPADAVRASFGVGLSLNDRLSVNFAYDQSFLSRTQTLIETIDPDSLLAVLTTTRQPSLSVGSFLFGGSYAINNRLRLNLNTAIGATDAAPDMRASLRLQMRLFD